MCFRSHTIPSISLKACAVLLCALEINPFVQWLHIYINPATQCYIHLAAHSVIRLSRYHIHIALVTVYCYNCSILLFIVSLLGACQVAAVISDSVTLWTIASQAPLSMGFSRHEYWSGLPCPPVGDLPGPGIGPACLTSPALAARFSTTDASWEALLISYWA